MLAADSYRFPKFAPSRFVVVSLVGFPHLRFAQRYRIGDLSWTKISATDVYSVARESWDYQGL